MTVFISHASAQSDLASALAERLGSAAISTWLAARDVPPGGNYAGAVAQAIGSCSAFLLLLSKESIASEHVAREVNLAVDHRRTIIPILASADVDMSRLPAEWRYWLGVVQAAPYEDPDQVVRIVRTRVDARMDPTELVTSGAGIKGAQAPNRLDQADPATFAAAHRPVREQRAPRADASLEAKVRSELIFIAAAQMEFREAQKRAHRLGFAVQETMALTYRLREARLLDFDGELDPSTVIRLT